MNKVNVHFDWMCSVFKSLIALTCKFAVMTSVFLQLLIQRHFPSITGNDVIYLQVNTVGVLVIIVCLSLAYCLWFCVSES